MNYWLRRRQIRLQKDLESKFQAWFKLHMFDPIDMALANSFHSTFTGHKTQIYYYTDSLEFQVDGIRFRIQKQP
jgi:hypothetical protein